MVFKAGTKGVEEDKATNLKNYYNAFSKDLTIDTKKGPRTRKASSCLAAWAWFCKAPSRLL